MLFLKYIGKKMYMWFIIQIYIYYKSKVIQQRFIIFLHEYNSFLLGINSQSSLKNVFDSCSLKISLADIVLYYLTTNI